MGGVKFETVVHQEKEKTSTVVQGGFEIIIKMEAAWESQEKLTILSVKVAEIAYPVDADYKDDSNEILKVLQVEEEDDDDEEEAEENFDDDDDVAMLQVCTLSVQNLACIKFGNWQISDFWRGFNLAIQNIYWLNLACIKFGVDLFWRIMKYHFTKLRSLHVNKR